MQKWYYFTADLIITPMLRQRNSEDLGRRPTHNTILRAVQRARDDGDVLPNNRNRPGAHGHGALPGTDSGSGRSNTGVCEKT